MCENNLSIPFHSVTVFWLLWRWFLVKRKKPHFFAKALRSRPFIFYCLNFGRVFILHMHSIQSLALSFIFQRLHRVAGKRFKKRGNGRSCSYSSINFPSSQGCGSKWVPRIISKKIVSLCFLLSLIRHARFSFAIHLPYNTLGVFMILECCSRVNFCRSCIFKI